MAIERVFLGFDRPGLPLAVDWIFSKYLRGERLDLQRVVLAAPGGLCRLSEGPGRAHTSDWTDSPASSEARSSPLALALSQ